MNSFLTRYLLYLFCGFIVLKASFVQPHVETYCLLLAKASVGFLSIFDSHVVRDGAVLYRYSYGYSIVISKGCSALTYMLTIGTAILAFPTSWISRLKGLSVALVSVAVLNLLRITSLLYFKILLRPFQFDLIHELVLPFLFGLSCILLFSYWAIAAIKDNTELATV